MGLHDAVEERDVCTTNGCFIDMPDTCSVGVRMKVAGESTK